MSSNKQVFLQWLESKNLPQSELDHTQARETKLRFNNHADDADSKSFLSKEKLDASFKRVLKASY